MSSNVDAGSAAIIGATIGFVGSLIGSTIFPLISGAVTGRQRAASVRHDRLVEIIVRLTQAFWSRLVASAYDEGKALNMTLAAEHEVVAELYSVTTTAESPIRKVAASVAKSITTDTMDVSRRHVDAFIVVSTQWLRGEISTASLEAEFTKLANSTEFWLE